MKKETLASRLLRYSMALGALYFFAMAGAHFLGIKVPMLFVYYDLPFFEYQDKVIAICSVVFALILAAAVKHRDVVPFAMVALFNAFVGLTGINLSDNFEDLMLGRPTCIYWIQSGIIFLFFLWLMALYLRVKSNDRL